MDCGGMKLSSRIEQITVGGTDGWEILYRSRALKARGYDITELTIGEHDIKTDQSIIEHLYKAAKAGETGYAEVAGTDVLRQSVAARIEKSTGVATGAENILITPGGQAALFAAHMAVLEQGDSALICDPYYATYPGLIRSMGAVPIFLPCAPAYDFQPRKQDILLACAAPVKSLLINSPNNPTGVVYTQQTMMGIAQACQEQDLWLISDEVYDTQVWEGKHISPRQLDDMQERTLVIGSLSKSHAMTGSRIGWICAPADVITHLINLSTHTTYGVAGYIQAAAVYALNAGDAFEAQIAAPFKRRRAIARQVLNGHNVLRPVPNLGAMYMMIDVRKTGLSGEEFAFKLLDEHAIAVMPGESFGTAAAGHIRVAMTVDDDRFAQAMETICAFATRLCGALRTA